ncbi:uncharacterized protein LOC132560769 [Ylistrum balloti]|uniref:uncharacterized protein LOC132560769 n=1 Tax=Ylistrum balloti TaxID=509963 RepID=UPI002905A5E6|nr:uncharacterized protein LOC132560769 [Ylistrum balloti]
MENVSPDVTPNPNPQQNHTVRVARPCHSNRKGQVKLNVTQQLCLKLIFHGNVHLRKELKRKECEEAIAAHSCLKGLEWKKIKNTIHNWITSKKIKTKKMLKQQER